MKNRLSLRLRLTIVTSVILTITCVIFALFSIYTAGSTIEAAVATLPSTAETIEAQELLPSTSISGEVGSITMSELARSHTQQFSQLNLWFMAATIVVGSLVMYFAAGLILKPLHRLSETIAAVDAKGLATRIEEYKAKDELNALADSFNTMMDKLHRAFERERRFSADAAHELKTPLAVMKTNVEVLDESAEVEDYANALQAVKKQADRMTALVAQLLEFSTMSGSSLTKQVAVAELVSAVVKEHCGDKAALNLEYCTVKGDPILLKQAVANLVQNALKYGDGTVKAEVKAEEGFVWIKIIDFGKGVPKEEREKIFEPFYRGDKSRSRAMGGSGLGLAIVWEIAKLHGGKALCEAGEDDKGAVFILKLPKYA